MIDPDCLKRAAYIAWEFEDAPLEFKELSGWSGEENWIFWVSEHVLGSMGVSHDGWPDLPTHIERSLLRIADSTEFEWHEIESGDWVAICCRG